MPRRQRLPVVAKILEKERKMAKARGTGRVTRSRRQKRPRKRGRKY